MRPGGRLPYTFHVERLFATLAVFGLLSGSPAFAGQAVGARMRIVVLEGEDAINVVQQKTAVAPVVEVRDRNNQPVAGLAVRFAIRNGRASFNGGRALTVTTNAAGRATAAGLTPTGTGTLQITASAAFQGQTAAATIVQTNVMTAAQAAAASSAGASATSTGTTAGAGTGGSAGGGLSTTTIGIVGGAAAGGTLVATQALSDSGTEYRSAFTITTSQFSQFSLNGQPTGTCTIPITMTGTVSIVIFSGSDSSNVSGQIDANWVIDAGTDRLCTVPWRSGDIGQQAPVSGTASNLTATGTYTDRSSTSTGPIDEVQSIAFSGVLANDMITGTLTLSRDTTLSPAAAIPPGQPFVARMAGSVAVTLTKQ